MVKNNLCKEAKTKKSVPTPKKKISKEAKTVQSVPLIKNKLQIILKKKQSSEHTKSQSKQITHKKKKSSEQPAIGKTPSRSPTEREKTPRWSSPRFKNRSEEHDHTAEKSTPTRSSPRKRKSLVELETETQSQPFQSTSGASQNARSKEVIEKQKTVKRKLYQSGPCMNVQIWNPNDTFSDMKRKRVPRVPTRMASLGLTYDKTKKPDKATASFKNKDHPIGDPSVQLASVLGVLVRQNIPLTFKDWRVVPKEAKANVWKIVKMSFIVDDFLQRILLWEDGLLS
ncbi:hypothetical protein MKW98_006517 [Papaver atlanticum]|uniref:Uncharacterized protein n=1 Tax=Papaver atlanticum TaxID=357466 RepID=A0AAD4T9F8_9MAGN|nr:hypothetical protein MKW98_006517 [Papaver atlanticum]